jgi:hypothetical protein
MPNYLSLAPSRVKGNISTSLFGRKRIRLFVRKALFFECWLLRNCSRNVQFLGCGRLFHVLQFSKGEQIKHTTSFTKKFYTSYYMKENFEFNIILEKLSYMYFWFCRWAANVWWHSIIFMLQGDDNCSFKRQYSNKFFTKFCLLQKTVYQKSSLN